MSKQYICTTPNYLLFLLTTGAPDHVKNVADGLNSVENGFLINNYFKNYLPEEEINKI